MANALLVCWILLGLVFPEPAAAPEPGELVITEVFVDPKEVQDRVGEYFALRNASTHFVALEGLVVRDGKSEEFQIGTDIVLAPGELLCLGPNPDPETNGGIAVDYTYARFNLSNTADRIVLEWDGVEIDAVEYDRRGGWPLRSGTVLALDPLLWDAAINDVPAAWTCAPLSTDNRMHAARACLPSGVRAAHD